MAVWSIAQMVPLLAARLNDPEEVFWTSAGSYPELNAYLREAVRVWGAATQWYRNTQVFRASINTSFYDLQVADENTETPILAPTITADRLVADCQMRLMEPVTPAGWTGSEQFTLADVTQALTRRRDAFLLETGQILTVEVIENVFGRVQRVPVPCPTIQIRRASFADMYSGQWSFLFRESLREAVGFNYGSQQAPGAPLVWSVDVTSPYYMLLSPPPINNGQIRLVVVNTGPIIDPVTPGPTGVPDDWAWVTVYGALADLFGKAGLAQDLARAKYCESRWQQGLQWARAASRVLQVTVDGQAVEIEPLVEADGFLPGWENLVGPPQFAMVAGMNLVAIAASPDDYHGVAVECIMPAPLPANDADCFWFPDECVDMVLDYAQHLAAIKQGAGPIAEAQGLLDRAFRGFGVKGAQGTAEDRSLDEQTSGTRNDEAVVPRVGAA